MKDRYKSFQGVIKLWCFSKWADCNVICPSKSLICSADVIAVTSGVKIGFVFTFDKEIDFLKQQIFNCQRDYDKVYLVTDKKVVDSDIKMAVDDDMKVLSIYDEYGFGNVIQEMKQQK